MRVTVNDFFAGERLRVKDISTLSRREESVFGQPRVEGVSLWMRFEVWGSEGPLGGLRRFRSSVIMGVT